MMLVLSVGVFACSINQIYAQTKHNYSGNFNTETMNGIAKYQYYENNKGERIYDGKFSFEVIKSPNKPFLEYGYIEGDFKNNAKNGEWVYTRKTSYKESYTFECYNCSYEDGKLDGEVHYGIESQNGLEAICNVTFKRGNLIGKFSYISTTRGINVEGQFDDNGYMDGVWKTIYREGNGVTFEIRKTYRNGGLVKNIKKDVSTGEIEVIKDDSGTKFWSNYNSEQNSSVFWSNDGYNQYLMLVDVEKTGSYNFETYGSWFPEDLFIGAILYKGDNLLYDIPKGSPKEQLIIFREIGLNKKLLQNQEDKRQELQKQEQEVTDKKAQEHKLAERNNIALRTDIQNSHRQLAQLYAKDKILVASLQKDGIAEFCQKPKLFSAYFKVYSTYFNYMNNIGQYADNENTGLLNSIIFMQDKMRLLFAKKTSLIEKQINAINDTDEILKFFSSEYVQQVIDIDSSAIKTKD